MCYNKNTVHRTLYLLSTNTAFQNQIIRRSYKNSKIYSENFSIARIVMTEIKQNLVVFMEENENPSITSVKAGNMCFNRFCIEEDAAFELSEVYYLKKTSNWRRPSKVRVKGKKN